MNEKPGQARIIKTVVNGMLPGVGQSTCAGTICQLIQGVVDGTSDKSTARWKIGDELKVAGLQIAPVPLNLCIDTAIGLAFGYRDWISGQDQDILDQWPAQELIQEMIISEPVNWVEKWQQNGGRIFPGGRMIALKSDPVWIWISSFVLPFPPFDIGSGMGVTDVDWKECRRLGMVQPGQKGEGRSVDLNFREVFDHRVKTYFSPEGKQQRLEIAMAQGPADDLLRLAKEQRDEVSELTEEKANQIAAIVDRSLKHGFGEHFQWKMQAYELLIDVYEEIEQAEKVNQHRNNLLECLKDWVAKGIPIDFNQRANIYGAMADLCDKLNRPSQAADFRQLQEDNKDGFALLGEALEALKSLGKQVDQEAGTRIIEKLTKAVDKIPQKYPERHAEAYRATAEILECWGSIDQAIAYYEYALQKNPKVGVKRHLDSLLKSKGKADVSRTSV